MLDCLILLISNMVYIYANKKFQLLEKLLEYRFKFIGLILHASMILSDILSI